MTGTFMVPATLSNGTGRSTCETDPLGVTLHKLLPAHAYPTRTYFRHSEVIPAKTCKSETPARLHNFLLGLREPHVVI